MRNFHVQRLFQAATEATQYIAANNNTQYWRHIIHLVRTRLKWNEQTVSVVWYRRNRNSKYKEKIIYSISKKMQTNK